MDILTRIKLIVTRPVRLEDIQELMKGYSLDGLSLKEYHIQLLETSRKNLLDYFPGEVLLPARKWVENLIDKAEGLIKDDFTFFNFVDANSPKEAASGFIDIMKKLGLPLLYNRKHRYFADQNIKDPQFVFKAIIESNQLLRSHDYFSCDIYNWCEPKGITCDLCKTSPWERVKQGKPCSLSTLWKIWGINEITFEKSL